MARNLTTQDVSWFLDLTEKNQLDLDPPYQRRSVWSLRDKRFFVDTILNNYPAPPVFLHKTLDANGRSTYHVVDGKQRLQTIIEFTEDKIRIPDEFADTKLRNGGNTATGYRVPLHRLALPRFSPACRCGSTRALVACLGHSC